MTSSLAGASGPESRRPTSPLAPPTPATFEDLAADLVWPKLLKAGSLAVRPSRVVMGLVWLIGVVGVLWVADKADRRVGDVLGEGIRDVWTSYWGVVRYQAPDAIRGDFSTRLVGPARGLTDIFLEAPASLLASAPVVTLIGLPLLLAWTVLFGGAISRSAASDFCLGRSIGWTEALGFGVSRWLSLMGAMILPLLLLWVLAFGMAVAGLLLRVPGLNMAVGLLWGLFLLFGLIGAAVVIAYSLGHTMLVPAVACEGTDAIDAVQHAYAYVFARPLRLIVYSIILIVQAAIVFAVAMLVAYLAIRVAAWSAQAFAGARGSAVFAELSREFGSVPTSDRTGATLTDTDRYTINIIRFWLVAFIGLVWGVGVSLYWTSSTLLYLAMRRIVDGQDMHELWSPGMYEDAAARARGASGPLAGAPVAQQGQGVGETGPADET